MRFVVRRGQRTWHGQTRDQVLARAGRYDREAASLERLGNYGDKEHAHRLRDRATFYRKQAERMQK